MAKSIELTIEQACEHPECFMYAWATEEFLSAIDPKYASIIRTKGNNERKVLILSADKYLGDFSRANEYYQKVADAFYAKYDVSPLDALIILAQGGEVAGKNWKEGVYGVGALPTSTFAGITTDGGGKVTVEAANGHIMYNGKDITDESKTVYNSVKGETIPYQLFGSDDFGYTFMSQYNKTRKKYYAQSYTDDEGVTHSASTGKRTDGTDSASIWGNIEMGWDWIKNILNWLLSLFGIQTIPEIGGSVDTIKPSNTLPNQQTDGFVSKAGMGTVGAVLLASAALGMLFMGKKKKKASK